MSGTETDFLQRLCRRPQLSLRRRLQILRYNPRRHKFFNEADGHVRYDIRFFKDPLPLPDLQNRLRRLLEILSTFTDRFFLDAGTLLGAHRGGDFIPWDDDIDVGMRIDDLLAMPDRFDVTSDTVFERNPFARYRYPDPLNLVDARLICTATGAYVDVFAFRPVGSSHLTTSERIILGQPNVPRETLLPLGDITFAGQLYSAPRDVETYLHLMYGEDLSPDHEIVTATDGRVILRRIR